MEYKFGDIVIKETKIIKQLKSLPSGEYNTHELKRIFTGNGGINTGKSAGESWNAHFGKIIKDFSREHKELIEEIQSNTPISVDGKKTTSSIWMLRTNIEPSKE